jgi:glutamine amidotransferase
MKKIKTLKLDKILSDEVLLKKKPILGVCLGMQILFENLYENGYSKGLGFQEGDVKKIDGSFANITTPNIGWWSVKFNKAEIEDYIGKFNNFYFSHSYFVETNKEHHLAFIKSKKIPAATLKNNILGVQFHPEKSSVSGELILKWFIEEFNDF